MWCPGHTWCDMALISPHFAQESHLDYYTDPLAIDDMTHTISGQNSAI